MSFNNNNISNVDAKRSMEITEDVPTMRSMMIGGGAVPAMPLRRTLDDTLKGPLTKLPTLLRTASEAPIQNDYSRWKVSAALEVPSYYDFERTHARVKGLSAMEVSKRIDDCLRAHSIAASFDNEQAIVRATCPKCVKFAVRLWKCQDDIVVEVQRSSGCSFVFQQIAKLVLESADPALVMKGIRAPPPLPRSLPPIPDAVWEANICEGIMDATNAFKNTNRIDSHLLAIESLVDLSGSSKCKRACAEAVLESDGFILPHVVALIQFTPKGVNTFIDEMEALMHRHALNLLANCLETIQATGGIVAALEKRHELTSNEILRSLLRELNVDRPHDAAAACRCLSALVSGSSDLKARALSMGARDAATAVSGCRHATLETESAKLKQIL